MSKRMLTICMFLLCVKAFLPIFLLLSLLEVICHCWKIITATAHSPIFLASAKVPGLFQFSENPLLNKNEPWESGNRNGQKSRSSEIPHLCLPPRDVKEARFLLSLCHWICALWCFISAVCPVRQGRVTEREVNAGNELLVLGAHFKGNLSWLAHSALNQTATQLCSLSAKAVSARGLHCAGCHEAVPALGFHTPPWQKASHLSQTSHWHISACGTVLSWGNSAIMGATTFDTGTKLHGPQTHSLQSSHFTSDLSALLLQGKLQVILEDWSRNENLW